MQERYSLVPYDNYRFSLIEFHRNSKVSEEAARKSDLYERFTQRDLKVDDIKHLNLNHSKILNFFMDSNKKPAAAERPTDIAENPAEGSQSERSDFSTDSAEVQIDEEGKITELKHQLNPGKRTSSTAAAAQPGLRRDSTLGQEDLAPDEGGTTSGIKDTQVKLSIQGINEKSKQIQQNYRNLEA